MDFGLSEDQRILEATLAAYLGEHASMERVRRLREAPCPNDRALWRGLAELGAAGVLVPEARGGSALSLLDAALVAQGLGAHATPAPFLSSGVLAPVALGACRDARSEPWLEGLASGELVMGVALTELFSVREGAGVAVEAGRVRGKSMMAIDACGADRLLIATGDGRMAVLRADDPGVSITRLRTTDATRCTAEVVLEAAVPEAILDDAAPALARALDAGRIALAADVLGACETMIARSVSYAQERRQFGRPIGSFQAVKHMCAEMVAELEPARSLVWYAAHAFDALPEEAPVLACHALAHCSEIGREIASVATQVHGGIGWTDEENLHFWFKRIALARHLLGGPELLRERAARLQSLDLAS